MMKRRILTLTRWISTWAIVCIQLSLFPLAATAQEPTDVPTPTSAPTWTATPIPTKTPIPTATSTPGTPAATSSPGATVTPEATITPTATSAFVPATPILINDIQPAVYQDTSGAVIVTPVGALGSVQVLPETGYLSPRGKDATQPKANYMITQPRRSMGLSLEIWIGVLFGIVMIGLTFVVKHMRQWKVF